MKDEGWQLFTAFLTTALFAIGGASSLIPEFHRQIVDVYRLMNDAQFASAVALAQLAPGPNMLISSLVGWRVAGFAGAMVARAMLRLWRRQSFPILLEAAIVAAVALVPMEREAAVLVLALGGGADGDALYRLRADGTRHGHLVCAGQAPAGTDRGPVLDRDPDRGDRERHRDPARTFVVAAGRRHRPPRR